ncbi:GW domain-containing glycosaminoglycan-binding protein [Listeria costaricensis]|uniref:GW domain-containing glycosaminoglycan-binding protein n=1 Tax=Listeria costaricensis TaxID=2026604 RepID=UPI000C06F599|nr:GW domain-containing glycosaminoglycan-binding protein [Listeria costaricensis]
MKLLLKSAMVAAGLAVFAVPGAVSADEVSSPSADKAEDDLKGAENQSIYIPKSIRDGEVTDENDGFEDEQTEVLAPVPLLRAAAYPNVNSYIKSKNFSTASIEYQLKSQFPKFNYRNGYGKPEGIVLHETANDSSTIQGEINYMSNNYNNAFVHAFADKSNIIQIHPTDYGVWGAGQYANARFIQIELCRSSSFDDFARSINNYAYYVAYMLDKYNLGVDSAEADGKGTIWSHNAVTKYLGGTTHTDPIGYFSKWGYTMTDMVSLIQEKYNQIHSGGIQYDKQIWAYGRVKTSAGHTVWTKPYGASGATMVNPLSAYEGKKLRLEREAKNDRATWYQFSVDGKIVGWVDQKAIDVFYNQSMETNTSLTQYVTNPSGSYYLLPVEDAPIKLGSLSSYQNKALRVDRKATIDGELWYRVYNGSTLLGWTKASNLYDTNTNSLAYDKQVWAYGRVKTSTGHTVWSKPYGMTGATTVNPLSAYEGKKLRLEREAQNYRATWYQFSVDGEIVGWVDQKAIDVFYDSSMEVGTNLTQYVYAPTANYYLLPVEDSPIKLGTLSSYQGKALRVDRKATIDGELWYRIYDGNTKLGWTKAANLSSSSPESLEYDKQIWAYGRVKTSAGHTVWTKPYGMSGATTVNPLSAYTGKNLRLEREAKNSRATWYQFSVDGKIVGWVDQKALDVFYNQSMEVNTSLTQYVANTSNSYYLLPVEDSPIQLGSLANYKGKALRVDRKATIDGELWYRINDGNTRLGWTKASNLSSSNTESLEYDKQIWAYGRVKTSAGHTVWTKPYGTSGAVSVNPLSAYTGKKMRLEREAKNSRATWYQFSVDGKIVGWVDQKAIDVFYNQSMEINTNLTQYVANTSGSYYLLPVEDSPIRLGSLSGYKGKALRVDRKATIDGELWYRVYNGNTLLGWTKASFLSSTNN